MEETKSSESRQAIQLQISKSNYSDGVDGVSEWKVEVDRAVAMLKHTHSSFDKAKRKVRIDQF
jgi:hypothetical protein